MPQMMPLNWMMSFFLFIFIFILFNLMNYFLTNHKFISKISYSTTSYSPPFLWKW